MNKPFNTALHADIWTANAAQGQMRVFIRSLTLSAHIGIHAHERTTAQPVIFNLDLLVDDVPPPKSKADIVCYEAIAEKIRKLIANGHIELLETLAERVAHACLADARVAQVRVQVEKPHAIAEAESAGVEIERIRPFSKPIEDSPK
ncbi:MAG: dihydroneopterin aldolase [Alphaproteobacteria bacterium]|nr:dihydroneopterin aldolase [Alphaproteobacteria bacterium]